MLNIFLYNLCKMKIYKCKLTGNNFIFMKKAIVFMLVAVLFSCNNKPKEEKEVTEVQPKVVATKDTSKIGRKNYAVVWKWTTTDVQLVEDNLLAISNEINVLWKDDVVTDAYYNPDATVDKFEYFPNVSFFLKAHSYEEGEALLNKLTLVKKGIAMYTMYPVGTKWMGRNEGKIHENGITNSYVAVWTTENMENSTDELTKSQADAILGLWNEGKIENVYFDIEGTQKANNETDFVFFINTNSPEEAKAVCDALPFVKKNIASYELFEVGVFWLGEFKDNQ